MVRPNIRLDATRLYLRFPKRGDFADWSRIRLRDRAYLEPWEPLWTVDANSRREWRMRLDAWRRAWRKGSGYAFLIFQREHDRLLGGLALTQVRHGSANTGTLGYWLASDMQGQGYMSEAVERICQYGAEVLGLARIEAATVLENIRSQSVLERCGFEREGVARSYLQIAGTRRDHVLFGRVFSHQDNGGIDEQSS